MAEISKQCSVFNGFNFRKDLQETIGHVTKLKIGDKELKADFTEGIKDPETESDVKTVGVMSSFYWEGGYAQPLELSFQISITNKNEVATLLHTELKNIAVEVAFEVFEYDPEKKKFFKSIHTNDQALKALLQVQGSERQLYLADEQGAEVEQPLNYQVQIGVVPEEQVQEIHVAVATDHKFVKPWGVGRG